MNRLCVFGILIYFLSVLSCGGGNGTEQKDMARICQKASKVYLSIRNYQYQMDPVDYMFNTKEFNIASGDFYFENDSTARLILRNYNIFSEENIHDFDNDRVEIITDLRSRHGENLRPGKYYYNEITDTLWSRVRIITTAGQVWFNRGSEMPHQGHVKLKHICKNEICGEFNLSVASPDDPMIGIVKLIGEFSFFVKNDQVLEDN